MVDTRDYLMKLAEETLDTSSRRYAPREADLEQWDLDALRREVDRRLRHRHASRSNFAGKHGRRDPRRALGR